MNKIGDYIPLIIIALSFIYSFAKKAGKNTEKEANKTTLPNGLPQKNVVPRPQVKTISQPQTVSRASQAVSSARVENKKRSEMLATSSLVEEITDDVGVSLDFDNVEELKKGIIYAEIFNRRY